MKNKIALVFDFDGTVSPNVMLSLIFDSKGINEDQFWEYTETLAEQGYDRELSYLKSLCDFCTHKGIKLTNNELREIGSHLKFYPGFPEILDRLKVEAYARGFALEIYVITAGLQEMVDGSRLGPYLTRCWGCRYGENDEGTISFPMQIVTSASKVEKLYLIKRQLLEHAYLTHGVFPTLLERDFNIPPLSELLAEVQKIKQIQAKCEAIRASNVKGSVALSLIHI